MKVESVGLSVYPYAVARQRLGKDVLAATKNCCMAVWALGGGIFEYVMVKVTELVLAWGVHFVTEIYRNNIGKFCVYRTKKRCFLAT
jgi:hypothetical protein